MRSFGEFKKICEAVEEEQSPGRLAALARAAADAALRKELKKEYNAANKEAAAATADLEAATAAADEAEVVRDEKGKPVPKTRPYYLQNNPKAARDHAARKQEADDAVAAAQATIDDSTQRAADLEAQMASDDPLLTRSQQQAEREAEAAAAEMQAQEMGDASMGM